MEFKTTLFKALEAADECVADWPDGTFDVENTRWRGDLVTLEMSGGDYSVQAYDQEVVIDAFGITSFTNLEGERVELAMSMVTRRPFAAADVQKLEEQGNG